MGLCSCSKQERPQNPTDVKVQWGDKVKLGELTLKNRIVMAAMTRLRCDPKDGVPTPLVAEYYAQRAGSGLIITECAAWSQRGIGFPGAAHMFTQLQANGWKRVVDLVHKNEGLIFLQLIHAGRVTARALNGDLQPWAPSPIAVRAQKNHALKGQQYPIPKEMTLQDIETTKKQFQTAIIYAKTAGFDGIQISSGYGYLVDQFLRSHTNRRTDHYGGTAINRCRFVIELVQIAMKHFRSYQIGLKLSPVSRLNDNSDLNPLDTYSTLLKQLSLMKVGFVELVEAREKEQTKCLDLHVPALQQMSDVCATLRPFFNGLIIANNDFNRESGYKKLQEKSCNAISFARLHITNPDLAYRIIESITLNTNFDFSTFYGSALADKSKGYTDYPIYKRDQ